MISTSFPAATAVYACSCIIRSSVQSSRRLAPAGGSHGVMKIQIPRFAYLRCALGIMAFPDQADARNRKDAAGGKNLRSSAKYTGEDKAGVPSTVVNPPINSFHQEYHGGMEKVSVSLRDNLFLFEETRNNHGTGAEKCTIYRAGSPPITRKEIFELLTDVPGWSLDNGHLTGSLSYPTAASALIFSMRLWLSQRRKGRFRIFLSGNHDL